MEQTKETIQKIDFNITADKILFFDMDGTLVDTNFANFLSYKKAIHSVTQTIPDLVHTPDQRFNRGVLKELIPNLSETDYERIIQEKELYYKDFLSETELNKAVVDVLIKYSKTNKTVLVTNCRKDRALLTLNYFGLADKFSIAFYRQLNGNKNKTNKYQCAIKNLNISAHSVIVFENEKPEINDAIIAGIPIQNIFSVQYNIVANYEQINN